MKKIAAVFVLTVCIISSFHLSVNAQRPDYEKYGRMAIAVVAADYPGQNIQEYEYLGRRKINNTSVMDSFRFQVQENNQKFYVTVMVSHDLQNKKLINLTVQSQR